MIQSIPILDMRLWVHISLVLMMAGFALTLGQPGVTMVQPSWGQFIALASEPTWTTIFTIVTGIGIIGLTARSAVLRLACLAVLSMAHGGIAVGFFMAPIPQNQTISLAVWAYGIYAGQGLLLFTRRLHELAQVYV